MDKCLKPERFDIDPAAPDARRKWQHWIRTFTSYVNSIENNSEENKLNVLINHVDASVYEYFSEAQTYDAALRSVFNKPVNEIFARYLLGECKQQPGQSLDDYHQALKMLSRDCNFAAVSAMRHREEGIRDAFIAGIMSNAIRQRLLESENLDLNSVIAKARSLEAEQINAVRFGLKCSDLASYNTAAINGASSEE